MTDEVAAAPEAAPADVTPTPAPEAPAPSFEEKVDADLRGVWDKLHPSRDLKTGQFAAKQPQTPDDPADEGGEAVQPENKDERATPEAAPAIDPPISWTAELKQRWAALPPEVQTYVAQRDKESHEAITRQGDVIKSFEPLTQTLEQFRDVYESYNLPPDRALAYLFSAERALRTDPLNSLRELCAAYKVDPLDLVGEGHQPQGEQPQRNDPRVAAIAAELDQVKSALMEQRRNEERSRFAGIQQELAEFAKDKPHYETVRVHMASLIQSGAAKDLADAYDMACNAVPTVRALIKAEEQKAEEAKRTKEAEEKTRSAKKAASVNLKGSPGQGTNPKTIDDTLREVANRAYGLT